MSSSWRGVPILMLAAILLFAIAGLIHIIGIATPYWHETTHTTSIYQGLRLYHYGLWVTCSLVTKDAFDCTSYGDLQGYITATRALVILGLLFGALCIVVTGVWCFVMIDKHRTLFMITSLSCGFLSALFGIIGIIIYAAEINTVEDKTLPGTRVENTLAWSFALCTVSSSIAFIATVLLGIGSRQIEQ